VAAPRATGEVQPVDKLLNDLVARLEKAYGERLVSVVLYGSAAAGDHHAKFSDLNVLCVLREIGIKELAAAEEIFRWWRERGNPSPLLLAQSELAASADSFAIEFRDIRQHHRVLYGAEPALGEPAGEETYRAQVEHELRARLLRLRQKAAGAWSDDDLLRRLLADSVSTFCVLMRHALALYGEEAPPARREIVERASRRFGFDPAAFSLLLDLREERARPREVKPVTLLPGYLAAISTVVDAVDRLGKH